MQPTPPLERAPGFMVWNATTGRMPTVVHDTLEKALSEAERLTAQTGGQRFVIMGPVLVENATAAKYFSHGKAEGMAQSHREIMRAEAITDRLSDDNRTLKRRYNRIRNLCQNLLRSHLESIEDESGATRYTDDEIPF